MRMNWAKKVLMQVILGVLEVVSPALREGLTQLLIEWYKRALATDRVIDDLVAGAILQIFGIDPDTITTE